MALLKALGGTGDILPEEAGRWQEIEREARRIMALYGVQEIRTPLIEEASVFSRSLGEAAEIVTKQMYLFQDRGGRSVALRPEGTASVVRALIEHGLDKTAGLTRLYYLGPMFRAERPQAGRKRQFHQLGVEVFGSASPYQDVEVLLLLNRLLEAFEIRSAMFMVNTVGCRDDRPRMLKDLKAYFRDWADNLCEDCKRRLEVNPLRILDCKNDRCRGLAKDFVSKVCKEDQWLCPTCKDHWERFDGTLKRLNLPVCRERQLVRGLDYYTRTVFEVVYPGLGAQNAIAAGGRYDDLVESMGGASTPAIGFAVGLDRVLLAREADRKEPEFAQENTVSAFVATVSPAQIPDALALAEQLRDQRIPALANLEERPLDRQLNHAAKVAPAGYALILGEEEVKEGMVTVKEMKTRRQDRIPERACPEEIKRRLLKEPPK